MPGPPPKPPGQARHRIKPMANVLKLPKAGRPGPPPPFPVGFGVLDVDMAKVWAHLWSTPMAVAWERNNWVRSVARYLKVMQAAERSLSIGDPSVALLGEVRQMEDRLGLTPMALLRLRWEIDVSDEVAERRPVRTSSTRQRLKAVDGSPAA